MPRKSRIFGFNALIMKKMLVILWLFLLFSAVAGMFWYNDYVYHLPTPIPGNYRPVNNGTYIPLSGTFDDRHDKPVCLHFYNPSCPCSRFNIPLFRALVKEFGQQVDFAVVVVNGKNVTAKDIQDKLGVDIPVLFDASLAATCGVYSTPQAVLLDTSHRLYYRGNYNQNRYCTDEKTSFAKLAITELLQGYTHPVFSPLALKAYGCQAISCKK